VKQFREGLVFKAHSLCVSLNSRLESNKERERETSPAITRHEHSTHDAEHPSGSHILVLNIL